MLVLGAPAESGASSAHCPRSPIHSCLRSAFAVRRIPVGEALPFGTPVAVTLLLAFEAVLVVGTLQRLVLGFRHQHHISLLFTLCQLLPRVVATVEQAHSSPLPRRLLRLLQPVSYTHLTLPTIYS